MMTTPESLRRLRGSRLWYWVIALSAIGCSPERDPTLPPPPPPPPGLVPGQSYFDADSAIEYIVGNAPVIISAPHGGGDRPGGTLTRNCGIVLRDVNTQELARSVAAAYHTRFGRYPHVVINRLHRDRLDANRDSTEATCGNPASGAAWLAYHGFIESAAAQVVSTSGRGFLIDLHGHGHAIPRIELGYLLSGTTLDRSDAALNGDGQIANASSIRAIARRAGAPSFATLLRGPTSLGTLLSGAGIRAVPSATDPGPMGADYFSGGYITDRHGCRVGGTVCSVQVEAHFTGVRDNAVNRDRFAAVLVASVAEFLHTGWGLDLDQ